MIERFMDSLENKELEKQAYDFVHNAMFRFMYQTPASGNTRTKPYSLEELKSLLGEEKEIEILNEYANYQTLLDLIKDSKIHILEEGLLENELLVHKRYTVTNLEITIIIEVKSVKWDKYPQVQFAEANLRMINKPYERGKIREKLQGLLEIKKAELSYYSSIAEVTLNVIRGEDLITERKLDEYDEYFYMGISEKRFDKKIDINYNLLVDVIKTKAEMNFIESLLNQ